MSSAWLRRDSVVEPELDFYSGAGAGERVPAPGQRRLSTIKKMFKLHSFFLTRKMSFISKYSFFKNNSLLSMWELTKRISLRTSSVLSKVEPEPDLNTGSDQKVPAPQHWSGLLLCDLGVL